MKLEITEYGVAKLRGLTYREMPGNFRDKVTNQITKSNRNFEGAQTPFNNLGNRNFRLDLPDDIANQIVDYQMAKYGETNVKHVETISSSTGETITHNYLKVLVRYYGGPKDPKVYYQANGNYVLWDESMVKMVDDVRFETADLDIYLGHYIDKRTGKEMPKANLNNLRIVAMPGEGSFESEFGINTSAPAPKSMDSDDLPF